MAALSGRLLLSEPIHCYFGTVHLRLGKALRGAETFYIVGRMAQVLNAALHSLRALLGARPLLRFAR